MIASRNISKIIRYKRYPSLFRGCCFSGLSGYFCYDFSWSTSTLIKGGFHSLVNFEQNQLFSCHKFQDEWFSGSSRNTQFENTEVKHDDLRREIEDIIYENYDDDEAHSLEQFTFFLHHSWLHHLGKEVKRKSKGSCPDHMKIGMGIGRVSNIPKVFRSQTRLYSTGGSGFHIKKFVVTKYGFVIFFLFLYVAFEITRKIWWWLKVRKALSQGSDKPERKFGIYSDVDTKLLLLKEDDQDADRSKSSAFEKIKERLWNHRSEGGVVVIIGQNSSGKSDLIDKLKLYERKNLFRRRVAWGTYVFDCKDLKGCDEFVRVMKDEMKLSRTTAVGKVLNGVKSMKKKNNNNNKDQLSELENLLEEFGKSTIGRFREGLRKTTKSLFGKRISHTLTSKYDRLRKTYFGLPVIVFENLDELEDDSMKQLLLRFADGSSEHLRDRAIVVYVMSNGEFFWNHMCSSSSSESNSLRSYELFELQPFMFDTTRKSPKSNSSSVDNLLEQLIEIGRKQQQQQQPLRRSCCENVPVQIVDDVVEILDLFSNYSVDGKNKFTYKEIQEVIKFCRKIQVLEFEEPNKEEMYTTQVFGIGRRKAHCATRSKYTSNVICTKSTFQSFVEKKMFDVDSMLVRMKKELLMKKNNGDGDGEILENIGSMISTFCQSGTYENQQSGKVNGIELKEVLEKLGHDKNLLKVVLRSGIFDVVWEGGTSSIPKMADVKVILKNRLVFIGLKELKKNRRLEAWLRK